ncbi:hypothetical protein B4102_1202 [Heyndrickxia sporothermodurans]|nr:hypothetical protein B4102_1202 [Heyndrickxia sporothermodurans]
MNRHQIPDGIFSESTIPKHYRNWNKMIDYEELDLLFVSSLPPFHYNMVKTALKKGINIVCEKPFTMNRHESRELIELTTHYSAKVMIDFKWRFLPIRQKMKKLFQNNIGDLIHFDYHISSAQYEHLHLTSRGWMAQKQQFGGMLGAIGSHMIDCMRWIVGDEIEKINGFVHTHVPEGAGEFRDADDAFFIHGKMKNNSTFSLQLLSGVNHGFGSQLRIFGSAGTIVLMNDNTLKYGKGSKPLKKIHILQQENIPVHLTLEAKAYYPAFYPFLEKVYEYIIFDKLDRDLPTIQDGYENQVILDKILAN